MSSENDSNEVLMLLLEAKDNVLTTETISKQLNFEHNKTIDLISYLDSQNYTSSMIIYGNGTRRVKLTVDGKIYLEKLKYIKKSEINIFYSFQSDLELEDKLLRKQLTKALKVLKENGVNTNLLIDSRAASGSISIPELLFEQIDKCDIFICDINFIGQSYNNGKKIPNPNVLIELGYAAKTIGWEKVILFFNKENTRLEDLPFDIRQRTICWYNDKSKEELHLKLLSFINRIIKST